MPDNLQHTLTISVVIPTYNRSAQLIAAIDSVLAQAHPVAEILVCDDGSTDDSKEKVAALNDPLVKWIDCGRNGRPAIPRNKGIAASTGQYIAFLDSDDEWLPTKIQQQVNALVNGKFSAVCSNALISKNGKVTGNYLDRKNFTIDYSALVQSNYIMCSSMLVQKDVLLKSGLFPETPVLKALEDYALWLRVATFTNIYYLEEPLVVYTDDSAASIRKDSLSTPQQQALIFENFEHWIRQKKTMAAKPFIKAMEELFILKYLNRWQKLMYAFKKLFS